MVAGSHFQHSWRSRLESAALRCAAPAALRCLAGMAMCTGCIGTAPGATLGPSCTAVTNALGPAEIAQNTDQGQGLCVGRETLLEQAEQGVDYWTIHAGKQQGTLLLYEQPPATTSPCAARCRGLTP